MKMLYMDDPNSADKLIKAINEEVPQATEPSDVVFQTPQFDRVDDSVPTAVSNIEFDKLPEMNEEQLLAVGLRKWDGRLYLFPGEWHGNLPSGLKLESIIGEKVTVGVDHIDDDTRFGMLAYGIVPTFAKGPEE